MENNSESICLDFVPAVEILLSYQLKLDLINLSAVVLLTTVCARARAADLYDFWFDFMVFLLQYFCFCLIASCEQFLVSLQLIHISVFL